MLSILKKPYLIFWLAIPLVLALVALSVNDSMDFLLHDIYLVVASKHIGLFFVTVLAFIGFLYWLLRDKMLIKWMTFSHVFVTILTVFLILLVGVTFNDAASLQNFRISKLMVVLIFLTLFSQVIFLINLVLSSLRRE